MKKIKIYLDDLRQPPTSDFILCKIAEEAIKLINIGNVIFISFDHDLGKKLTGYDVAKYIEQMVFIGEIKCPDWEIHSMNPVGRKNIESTMQSAKKWGKEKEVFVKGHSKEKNNFLKEWDKAIKTLKWR